jgi:hypothetical protein
MTPPKDYRKQKWFSLENLADFIAEFNKDGEYHIKHSDWDFLHWLDKKCKPKK